MPPKGKQKKPSPPSPKPKPNPAIGLLTDIRDTMRLLLERLPGPPPPDARCANCHFFVQGEICRRHAPKNGSLVIPGGQANANRYWCGDWIRKVVAEVKKVK